MKYIFLHLCHIISKDQTASQGTMACWTRWQLCSGFTRTLLSLGETPDVWRWAQRGAEPMWPASISPLLLLQACSTEPYSWWETLPPVATSSLSLSFTLTEACLKVQGITLKLKLICVSYHYNLCLVWLLPCLVMYFRESYMCIHQCGKVTKEINTVQVGRIYFP